MIPFNQREDLNPICPYCKKEIKEILYRELKGDLGKRCLYFCPECRAALAQGFDYGAVNIYVGVGFLIR